MKQYILTYSVPISYNNDLLNKSYHLIYKSFIQLMISYYYYYYYYIIILCTILYIYSIVPIFLNTLFRVPNFLPFVRLRFCEHVCSDFHTQWVGAHILTTLWPGTNAWTILTC